MSARRLVQVLSRELRFDIRRPLSWIALALMLYMGWSLSRNLIFLEGNPLRVAGGEALWFSSEFALAQFLTDLTGIIYVCFLAVATGMAVIRDEEAGVTELLQATPLRSGEYAWGKFLGIFIAFLLVLAAGPGVAAFFNHGAPDPELVAHYGPFRVEAYVRPTLILLVPPALFVAGASFLIGALSGRAILVFLAPVMFVLGRAFFTGWHPGGMSPGADRLLMLLDPTGRRWLMATFFRVDRGVGFYNLEPIHYEGDFLASRLFFLILGLAAVAWATRKVGARNRLDVRRTHQPNAIPVAVDGGLPKPMPDLAGLEMSRRSKRPWRGLGQMVRSEFRELIHSPGLYLFTPVILISIMAYFEVSGGELGVPVLRTPSTVALTHAGPITLFLLFLLMVYGADTFWRDRDTGLAPISHATSVSSGTILFAKGLALLGLVAVVFLGALAGGLVNLMIQGTLPLRLAPFLKIWTFLALPTCLFWIALLMAASGLIRSRWTLYGLGIALILLTISLRSRGTINWAVNWFWPSLQSTEYRAFLELNSSALFLNRMMVVLTSVFLFYLAAQWFPRRDPDSPGLLRRLGSGPFLKGALRAAPLALPPAAISIFLWTQIQEGYQGQAAREAEELYWQTNMEEWADAELPALVALEVDLELDPSHRRFRSRGRYRLVNRLDHPLGQVPFTQDLTWDTIVWSAEDAPIEAENHAGLWILRPAVPLQPADSIWLGFDVRGTVPKGMTARGGIAGEFILPSSVLFRQFAPQPGFLVRLGAPEQYWASRPEPPPDLYLQEVPPLTNLIGPLSTRIRITGPDNLIYSSVGRRAEESRSQGQVRVTWESAYPVGSFHVVAGKWHVWRGEGTEIYYDPAHAFNLEEMGSTLNAARRWFSDWFGPLPWETLKLMEVTGMGAGALGYPTSIVFSEMGFLTKPDPRAPWMLWVTAHETAHQWWGNLLMPGNGPGGGILTEGMANFSALLLADEVGGGMARRELAKRMEESYLRRRSVDLERPLAATDGTRSGDGAVVYNKGGWVPWMLIGALGREPMLAGLKEFISRFRFGPDYPLLQDLSTTLREFAPDTIAFDDFVDQWFFDVVLPQYVVEDPALSRVSQPGESDTWETTFVVRNAGTGRMPVDVAVVLGQPFDADGMPDPAYREARITIILGAGEETVVTIPSDFRPERIVVDPDVRILQLHREQAVRGL